MTDVPAGEPSARTVLGGASARTVLGDASARTVLDGAPDAALVGAVTAAPASTVTGREHVVRADVPTPPATHDARVDAALADLAAAVQAPVGDQVDAYVRAQRALHERLADLDG